MKEIKVQLYRGEDDNYVELWRTIEKENDKCKYYGTEGIVFASNRSNKYTIRQNYPDIYDYDNCLI